MEKTKTATSELKRLETAVVIKVDGDEEALFITARSLMGKYRKYMIIASSEDALSVLDVSEDIEE